MLLSQRCFPSHLLVGNLTAREAFEDSLSLRQFYVILPSVLPSCTVMCCRPTVNSLKRSKTGLWLYCSDGGGRDSRVLSFRDVPSALSAWRRGADADRLLRPQEPRPLCANQLRLHRLLHGCAPADGPTVHGQNELRRRRHRTQFRRHSTV